MARKTLDQLWLIASPIGLSRLWIRGMPFIWSRLYKYILLTYKSYCILYT